MIIIKNGRPAAVLMSAEEYESWKKARPIQKNPALMEGIRRGLQQFTRGQRFSFEEVFGEPLKKSKRKKMTRFRLEIPQDVRDLLTHLPPTLQKKN